MVKSENMVYLYGNFKADMGVGVPKSSVSRVSEFLEN